jgi:heme exporter protein D
MTLDFDAGEYAFYVWTSFGLTALLVAWMIGDSLWRAAKWRRKAEALQAAKDAKKAVKQTSP